MKKLLSIQVSPVKTVETPNFSGGMKTWTTGIFKESVQSSVWMSKTSRAGDGQADLVNHGGADKAVNVYAAEHYPYWRVQLNLPLAHHGAFGENFTTEGLFETEVCIGDTYALGETIIQISQPRQPCWKLALKWHVKDLALQVERNGKTGWYFRVIKEGNVTAGDEFKLIERPYPRWTIEAANQIMHHQVDDLAAASELAAVPLLSESWQEALKLRAAASKELI